MDKLKMHSPNLTEVNIAKLVKLFPHCVTESTDDRGELKRSIDFDLLRQELTGTIVEGPQERYHLNWPGKREAMLTANTPIAKTLRPCREESVDFDTTENLFIEGDNLDALKLLQESYLGKVKMIYIDPPYNTGKDFIYEDNFVSDKTEYEQESGQRDKEGGRLVANLESNGRFHSDWLSMIYPRIKLARNLLRDDGVIFVSIDDNEVANLRRLCDEVFGEDSFLVQFSWRTDGNFDNQAKFKKCHEYILGYAKEEHSFLSPPIIDPNVPRNSKLYKDDIRNTIVKNGPKNPESSVVLPKGFPADMVEGFIEKRTSLWPHYLENAIIKKGALCNDVEVKSGWSSKDLLIDFIKNNCEPVMDIKGQESRFIISSTGAIEVIKKRSAVQSHVISSLQNLGGPQKAGSEVKSLNVVFDDYPKPVALIKYLCQMVRNDNDIILDFFAGSATTAHAVMQLNVEDDGNRKFIMVQLPEVCDEKTEPYKAGYSTIAAISKERIRRAGNKIKDENAITTPNLDIGFRVLKIDSSNMADVYYTPDAVEQDQFTLLSDNIKDDRSSEDLLFQVLLDRDVSLSLPITKELIADKEVFFVDENALAACFVKGGGITEEFVKELAKRKPLQVVFRDAGFKDDSMKINIEQIFKLMSPHTEVKTI